MNNFAPLKTRLSPQWQQLLNLTHDHHERWHLRPLFSLATQLGLEPTEICDETIDRLEREAIAAKIPRAKQVPRDAARTWNKLREQHGSWPRQFLTPPNHRKFKTIKLETMPLEFQNDVTLFFCNELEDDIFDVPRRRIKSPVTVKDSTLKIMQLVSRAVDLGVPLVSIRRLYDLSARATSEKILLDLYISSGQKENSHFYRLAKLLCRIAATDPEPDFQYIAQLEEAETNFRSKKKGISDKMQVKLRHILDDYNIKRILNLPEEVISKINLKKPKISDAWEVQSALAVCILIVAPMKEAQLAALDIKKHLKKINSHETRVVFEACETSNGRALEYLITGDALKILELYLNVYHPLLAKKCSNKLFISITGRQKTAAELATQIPIFIKSHLGLDMNISLFRHFDAYLHVRRDPGDFETPRRLLSHACSDTMHTLYGVYIKQQSFYLLDQLIEQKS